MYRSNSTAEENDKLITCINNVCSKVGSQHLVLTGDSNFPEIDWVNEQCKGGSNHPARHFMDTVLQNGLSPKVKEPTHLRVMQTPTLINLILTNENDLIQDIEHCLPWEKAIILC